METLQTQSLPPMFLVQLYPIFQSAQRSCYAVMLMPSSNGVKKIHRKLRYSYSALSNLTTGYSLASSHNGHHSSVDFSFHILDKSKGIYTSYHNWSTRRWIHLSTDLILQSTKAPFNLYYSTIIQCLSHNKMPRSHYILTEFIDPEGLTEVGAS
jgi:hypothetical protein